VVLQKNRFVSIGLRMLVNVEALNMVESVGNVVRHRVVPYVLRIRPGHYVLRWVPAISGESLAHAYQVHLAEVARSRGLPVCYWCSRGEFVKHFDLLFWLKTMDALPYSDEEKRIAQSYASKQQFTLDDIRDIEKAIVSSCVVEDVCGFLAQQGPTKRTSRFYTSFALPTEESVKSGAVALDNQFFVRHAPEAEAKRTTVPEVRGAAQAPYYVQIGSAIYGVTMNFEIDGIGVSSVTNEKIVNEDEARKRKEVALDALKEMLDTKMFGAKLTRFNPVIDYEIAVAIVQRNVSLTVSPPTKRFEEFIEHTVVRVFRALKDVSDAKARVFLWVPTNDIAKEVEKVLNDVETKLGEEYRKMIESNRLGVELLVSPSIRDFVDRIKQSLGLSK